MSQAKILFVDRDGCLIEEPSDFQVDSLDKFKLLPGVIEALSRLRHAIFPGIHILAGAKYADQYFVQPRH